jgi:hypothetical protein
LNGETEISKQNTDILNQNISIIIKFENIHHNNQIIQEFSKQFTSTNNYNNDISTDFIIVDKLNLLKQILIEFFPKK